MNFYFGGIGQSDGIGHGHVSMDARGDITYNRDVFGEHGASNYTDFKVRQEEYNRHFGRTTSNTPKSKVWETQDDNEDFTVKVKGGYLYNHPDYGKDPDIIKRTDFLFIDKKNGNKHTHWSIGDDTNWDLKRWHGPKK